MKLPDWDHRLRQFIDTHARRPFEWGVWDCVLFAAQSADFITGNDYSVSWIGRYNSQYGATRIIAEYFGGKFESIFDNYYHPTPHQLAQSGDIVRGVPPGDGPTHGIAVGSKVVFAGHGGLITYPASEVVLDRAWRVD